MALPVSPASTTAAGTHLQAPARSDRAAGLLPEKSLGYLLKGVLSSIRSMADAQLQSRGLTFAQCLPLYQISKCKDTTLAELARTLDTDPAAVTRLLDRLEKKALVLRERSTTDRRVVHVRTTPLGAEMAQELAPVLADTLNTHMAGFSNEEWLQLIGFLQRMQTNGDAARQPAA